MEYHGQTSKGETADDGAGRRHPSADRRGPPRTDPPGFRPTPDPERRGCLTDRVARLLLDDVDPQNILCLTYTKAAASEMQNRLFARLGKWAMLDDDKLAARTRNCTRWVSVHDDHAGSTTRCTTPLFARAIETPGGLKIQTIHSFCSSLLRRFPLGSRGQPAVQRDGRQVCRRFC